MPVRALQLSVSEDIRWHDGEGASSSWFVTVRGRYPDDADISQVLSARCKYSTNSRILCHQ
jgi:hypothetical protein